MPMRSFATRLIRQTPLLFPLLRGLRRTWRRVMGSARLKRQLKRTRTWNIVVGASGQAAPGWIASEVEFLNLLRPQQWERYFAPASINALLAEHVWEHLSADDGRRAAQTCFRFLKPGGYLRVAVPDGLHPDPQYIEWVRVNGTGLSADDHKVLYTYLTLREVFESAGFSVRVLEHFDEQGHFHMEAWEPREGMIKRSKRFDRRNQDGQPHYTSIVLDAHKPRETQ